MFKKGRKKQANQVPSNTNNNRIQVNTIIGKSTTIEGNMHFSGVLKVDGMVIGNLSADGEHSILILNGDGRIQGEVKVANIMVNGTVEGNVHASKKVELFENARIIGDVFYNLLEMEVGSTVNGKLIKNDSAINERGNPDMDLPPIDMRHAPDI